MRMIFAGAVSSDMDNGNDVFGATARSSRRARMAPPLSESCLLGLGTDGCLGEYRRMKERGVVFDGEPQSEPWDTGSSSQRAHPGERAG